MKKYFLLLPASLLALASCSQQEPDPAELSYEGYTRSFIKIFGLIDPNHTWGFTFDDEPQSRTIATNGNQWVDDWWYPQNVTKEEHNLVMAYVSNTDGDHLTSIEITDPAFKAAFHNFFLTHVGASNQKYDLVGEGAQKDFSGSSKMDLLRIAETEAMLSQDCSTWPDVNNFNAASNPSWEGHMLVLGVTNSEAESMTQEEIDAANLAHGAYGFCYRNSTGGGYYQRYKIVPGSAIPNANGTLDHYYYLCFDYEVKNGNNETSQTEFSITYQIDGQTYTAERQFTGVYLDSDPSEWPTDEAFATALGNENAVITDKTIRRYINADVLEPNNIYNDWVIRLVGNATRKTETPPEYVQDPTPTPNSRTKRVFVEDLAAHASYNLDNAISDWDFNDVVFDVSVDKDSHKATIKLLALGGTLPVYIGTDTDHHTPELHSLMGFESNVMINTGTGVVHEPVMVSTGDMQFDPYDYRSVKVFVEVGGKLREMTAETGGAPAKIAGRTTDTWPSERQFVCLHWPAFRNWVNNSAYSNWTAGLPD